MRKGGLTWQHRLAIDLAVRLLFALAVWAVVLYVMDTFTTYPFGAAGPGNEGAIIFGYQVGAIGLAVIVGIPAAYITFKGVNFSPDAAEHRVFGLGLILYGVATFVGAGILSLAIALIGSGLVGPMFLIATGVFATGAAMVVGGLVALITGHDMRKPLGISEDDN